MANYVSKPTIKQKTTWAGLGMLGWAIYSYITGNLTEGSTALVTAIGLIFASDN